MNDKKVTMDSSSTSSVPSQNVTTIQVDSQPIDYSTVTYLQTAKEASKIQTRLNFLETALTEMLAHESQLYIKLEETDGKLRWRAECEERVNPVDLKFFLTTQQDEFFAPEVVGQVEPIIRELQRIKNDILLLENEQNTLREKLRKILPNLKPPTKSDKKGGNRSTPKK